MCLKVIFVEVANRSIIKFYGVYVELVSISVPSVKKHISEHYANLPQMLLTTLQQQKQQQLCCVGVGGSVATKVLQSEFQTVRGKAG